MESGNGEVKPILGMFLLILGTGCVDEWDEKPVHVTREEFGVYWTQLERQWPVFFEGQCVPPPKLPREWEVFLEVTFIEVEASSRFPTCSYRRSSREIRIGDDKWGSSCVPHEIGHAACHVLGISVCFDFEHPDYISKC